MGMRIGVEMGGEFNSRVKRNIKESTMLNLERWLRMPSYVGRYLHWVGSIVGFPVGPSVGRGVGYLVGPARSKYDHSKSSVEGKVYELTIIQMAIMDLR